LGIAIRPGGDAQPHQETFRETLAALALALEPTDRLLEVGCGGGTLLEWALASGCTARGVDHSGEMLSLARERNARAIADGRLELREADAQRLPFADGEFAAAATTNAFFFFADPGAMLAEARRTLAPGGRIAVYTAATAYMAPPATWRRRSRPPQPWVSRWPNARRAAHTSLRFIRAARARPAGVPYMRHEVRCAGAWVRRGPRAGRRRRRCVPGARPASTRSSQGAARGGRRSSRWRGAGAAER
jgi:SAM-dependent methyltransferase